MTDTDSTSNPPEQLERPRFLDELVVVPLNEGIVVDGGYDLHILKGDATRGLAGSLTKLMDGTRTLQQLEKALPDTPAEHLRAVLSMFTQLGLVEEGVPDHQTSAIKSPEALAFFRRYRGATRINRDGLEAYEKLEQCQILILAPENAAAETESLKFLLEKSGALHVSVLPRESLKTHGLTAGSSHGRSLAINIALRGEDTRGWAELDDWCAKHQLPWLRAVIDTKGNYADLGPVFNRENSACYRCFHKMHVRDSPAPSSVGKEGLQDVMHYWIGMIAVEALYFLSGVGPLAMEREFHRYDLRQWKSREFRWARVPGCSTCCPLSPTMAESSCSASDVDCVDTAMVFEDIVGLGSRALVGAVVAVENPDVSLTIGRQPKRLSSCKEYSLNRNTPRLELPTRNALLPDVVCSRPGLNSDDLAAVLMMTGGVRSARPSRPVKRWAATAGNLGSVELYVAVRNVEGLAPGFYFYRPLEHSLARFERRGGALPVDEFVRRVLAACTGTLPDALVLFTGAFHRLARKYGAFGYRLAQLDAGAAVSQLDVVARSLNIPCQSAVRWADDLIEEHLGLEPFEEQSTAVVALSRQEGHVLPTRKHAQELRMGLSASAKAPNYFFEKSMEQILWELYRESRVKESNLGVGPFADSRSAIKAWLDEGPSVSLPKPALDGRPVGEVLYGRESVREFADMSVSKEKLSTMLCWAYRRDAGWFSEQTDDALLNFLVLAGRVEGLAPALYRYKFDADSNSALQLLSPLGSVKDRIGLFVQAEFASAPVCVWIVGNLSAACARRGAFGHRQLLLRAGAAGHRLWMGALAIGLSGCLVAGLVPGAARRQLLLDGYVQTSLLGFVAGYSANSLVPQDNWREL